MPRAVRVCFNRKGRSVKVSTTVRVKHQRHPKQVYLCYLPSAAELTDHALAKIEANLKGRWVSNEAVFLDREDARTKWKNLDSRKRRAVDRESAVRQFRRWLELDFATLEKCFNGVRYVDHDDDEAFPAFYFESHRYICGTRKDIDQAEVANWWVERELPRLLYRYYAYIRPRQPKYTFSAAGFMNYAKRNIMSGYARQEFLRYRGQQPERPVSMDWMDYNPWVKYTPPPGA